MPRISMRFWGLLKDGKIVEVYKSERIARRAIQDVDPQNKHGWEIMPVQVIYD